MYNSQANNPLFKGFTCQYCGNTFRSRQGLSGHIQFKHGITGQKKVKQVEFKLTKKDVTSKLVQWKAISKPSEFEYEAVVDMFLWWIQVKTLFKAFGLELNEQDLHNYVITSLANIRQSTQLLNSLELPSIN